MNMALHPASHAVEDYLAKWFRKGVIAEFELTEQQCWVFKVECPRRTPECPIATLQLRVSTQFLDKTNDYDIGRLLQEWYVAGRMRLAGPNGWVLVTLNGVSQGVPQPA
jgi:hypothetical protein